ncbi:hypothetical protein RSWS8N_01735 [Cereibacter sphaeroides WS8N]|nr:hypothetical protein RSWS8N_01735 [Cereibacter sphaeroides WS8N]
MDGYTDVPPDGFAGRLEVRGSVGSAALEKARIASESYRPAFMSPMLRGDAGRRGGRSRTGADT